MRSRSLVLLVLAYISVIALSAFGAERSTSTQLQALDRRLDARSVTAAGFIEAYVADVFRQEQQLARLRLRGPVTSEAFGRLTREHGFDAAVLLDDAGRLLAVSPAGPALAGTNLASRYPHLAAAVRGRQSISDIVPAAGDGRPVVGFAIPFDTPQGRRVFSGAYVTARTPLADYMNNVSALRDSESYLVDSRGTVVAYGSVADRDPEASAATWPAALAAVHPALARAVTATTARGPEARSGTFDLSGTATRWTSAAVDGTPWYLVSTVPESVLYAPAANVRPTRWAAVGTLALLGLVLIALVARDHLRAAQLQRSERELRSMLDSTSDAVVGTDSTGTITAWNAAAETLFGWSAEEAHGRPMTSLIVPPRYRDAHARGIARILAHGEPVALQATEVSALTRDGDEIDVELIITGVPGQPGRSRRRAGDDYLFRGFVRDIRPRRAAEQQMRMLAGLVAATGDAIVSCDMSGTITSWNSGAERLYGFTEEEALGRPLAEVLPTPGDFEAAELGGVLRLVYSGRRVDSVDTTRMRKDGTPIRVSISMAPLTDADGRMVGIVSSTRDITAAHEHDKELREAEERFRLAFDAVPTGMLLTSLDPADPGRIVRANSAMSWMLGYTEAELRQRTFEDVTHPEDRAPGVSLLDAFRSGEQRSLRFERRYLRADGQVVWTMVSAAAVHDRRGEPSYVVSQIEDITTRRHEQDRLKALALTDALTGLSNRADFDDKLVQALRRRGTGPVTVGVIYCDLDGFKPVNDQFGHDVGDDLLRQVAHRLQAATRPSDVVARLGGDEFAVICTALPDRATAERVAARVRETIEGTYLLQAGTVTIGVSLGLATVDLTDDATADPATLVKQADSSMYAEKRERRRRSRDQPPAMANGREK